MAKWLLWGNVFGELAYSESVFGESLYSHLKLINFDKLFQLRKT